MNEATQTIFAKKPESINDLNLRYYQANRNWAKDHAEKHKEISPLETNPHKYPEQLPTTAVTREKILPRILPNTYVTNRKLKYLAKNVGKLALANFEQAFARSISGVNIGRQLRCTLDNGNNVVLATGHAQDLFDLAYAHLTASCASNRHRGGIFLNKTMAWEAYKDKPITKILSYMGDIIWVTPDTDSTTKYDIPRDTANVINYGATKQFWHDLEAAKKLGQGRLISVVPSGTSMKQIYTDNGQLKKLIMPPTSKTTKGVLSKADTILPVAVYNDEMLVGDMISFRDMSRQERVEAIGQSIGQLATMTSELAQVPCIVED